MPIHESTPKAELSQPIRLRLDRLLVTEGRRKTRAILGAAIYAPGSTDQQIDNAIAGAPVSPETSAQIEAALRSYETGKPVAPAATPSAPVPGSSDKPVPPAPAASQELAAGPRRYKRSEAEAIAAYETARALDKQAAIHRAAIARRGSPPKLAATKGTSTQTSDDGMRALASAHGIHSQRDMDRAIAAMHSNEAMTTLNSEIARRTAEPDPEPIAEDVDLTAARAQVRAAMGAA